MNKKKLCSVVYFATMLCLSSTKSFSLDIDAGDYTPLPSGTNLGLLYLQNAERKELYNDGEKISRNSRLTSYVSIIRGVHYTELGGKMVNVQFLLPFANLNSKKDLAYLGNSKGVGDPIIASTLWLNDRVTDPHIYGITQYLFIPIGKYSSNRNLNIGENRWKYTLQGGYIGKINDKLFLDFTADVTFFGENDDLTSKKLTLNQENLYQAQTYFRYKPSNISELYIGYSRLWSGETKIERIRQNDKSNQQKLMVGGSKFISSNTQIMASFGRDIKVNNGLKEDARINLRLLHLF